MPALAVPFPTRLAAGCVRKGATHRRVCATPNARGEVELGPMRDAHGMGDTLTVTPCAARLPNAVVLLPHFLSHWAPLFDGLCPVRFTDDYPEFPFCGGRPVVESNLAVCGLHEPGALPEVRLTVNELAEARRELANCPRPIALAPTCSRQNAALRGRPPEFFTPIVQALAVRHTVLQFGYEDYPLIEGARRVAWKGVRHLAALYACTGLLVSLNTGDYHLMLAVGGRCVVIERPEREMPNNASIWRYDKPALVRYASFYDPGHTVSLLPWLDG